MWSLAGKKCIVTGGNQGIGFAIAKRFLGEGANVCLVGRNAARVDDAVRRLQPGIRPPESDPDRTDAQPRLHGHVCEAISGQKDWIELFAKHVSPPQALFSLRTPLTQPPSPKSPTSTSSSTARV